MTQLRQGQPVGRLSAALLGAVAAALLMWASAASVLYAALLGLAPTSQLSRALGRPLPSVVALVLVVGAAWIMVAVYDLAAARFGQVRVASRLAWFPLTGGLATSGIAWALVSYTEAPDPAFDIARISSSTTIPRELGGLVALALTGWSIFRLGGLIRSLRHARARQRMIESLRRDGRRQVGTVTEVEFRNLWVFDDPMFHMRVSGPGLQLRVHMRTSPERVPAVGSTMLVFTSPSDERAVHVELAPDTQFEADYQRWVAPD